mmetsp:Transcript_6718/g.15276  ORF Transcript_6718/g.15276 Transcript_6718/m.15276 type:complete len:216 (-) Transcript_6718:543-1190(-)
MCHFADASRRRHRHRHRHRRRRLHARRSRSRKRRSSSRRGQWTRRRRLHRRRLPSCHRRRRSSVRSARCSPRWERRLQSWVQHSACRTRFTRLTNSTAWQTRDLEQDQISRLRHHRARRAPCQTAAAAAATCETWVIPSLPCESLSTYDAGWTTQSTTTRSLLPKSCSLTCLRHIVRTHARSCWTSTRRSCTATGRARAAGVCSNGRGWTSSSTE